MIDAVWSQQPVDMIFLFMTAYERDEFDHGRRAMATSAWRLSSTGHDRGAMRQPRPPPT